MRILVAEDERITRMTLPATTSGGTSVCAVEDGQKAWEHFPREGAFDMLITDWEMPHLTGVDLVRQVRGRKGDDYSYIILLTSRSDKSDSWRESRPAPTTSSASRSTSRSFASDCSPASGSSAGAGAENRTRSCAMPMIAFVRTARPRGCSGRCCRREHDHAASRRRGAMSPPKSWPATRSGCTSSTIATWFPMSWMSAAMAFPRRCSPSARCTRFRRFPSIRRSCDGWAARTMSWEPFSIRPSSRRSSTTASAPPTTTGAISR